MGEYAEMEIERAEFFEFERELEELVAANFWKCKGGRVMAIADMKTSHLQNTIAMLERKNNPRFAKKLAALHQELASRTKADD